MELLGEEDTFPVPTSSSPLSRNSWLYQLLYGPSSSSPVQDLPPEWSVSDLHFPLSYLSSKDANNSRYPSSSLTSAQPPVQITAIEEALWAHIQFVILSIYACIALILLLFLAFYLKQHDRKSRPFAALGLSEQWVYHPLVEQPLTPASNAVQPLPAKLQFLTSTTATSPSPEPSSSWFNSTTPIPLPVLLVAEPDQSSPFISVSLLSQQNECVLPMEDWERSSRQEEASSLITESLPFVSAFQHLTLNPHANIPSSHHHHLDESPALSSSPQPAQLPSSECNSATASPSRSIVRCRKLQERRGSSHSLTIALKPLEDQNLAAVTGPRDNPTEQFLRTASHVLTREALRDCCQDVRTLHAEFWSIPTNLQETVEVEGSGLKNRYHCVIPNAHSRVRLPSGSPLGAYINANYIKCAPMQQRPAESRPAFIATQGPLPHTVEDFWLMVFSERSPVIVMITKCVEGGRTKCETYLPDQEGVAVVYGSISVSVLEVRTCPGYTLRKLRVECQKVELEVLHYWYTDWADHKTPDNPQTLVDLAVHVEQLRLERYTQEAGPLIVHCSAGLGRTGCFIALCLGIQQLLKTGSVDVLGIVCSLRGDRGGMVQTAEQYEFIHRGLCLFESRLIAEHQDRDHAPS